jgi:hypothetical protein
MEFDLSAQILKGNLNWNISGNISFNRNKILSFDGRIPEFFGDRIGTVNSQSLNIAKVGHPIGAFYGYKIIGIYQTQQEVLISPIDASNPRPGDFKFADISGPDGVPDGMINANDVTVIGNPYPDYIFGVTNDFNWKNFSLNVFIQGSIGQDVVNTNNYYLTGLSFATSSIVSRVAYENRWTTPGSSNKYPAAQSQRPAFFGRFSDFLVEDASYIRLKGVTLSYSLPERTMKYVNRLKIFISGNNLFTITKYTGYDPEVSSRGDNSLTPGIDLGSIPQFRTISAGINVGF